MALKKGSRRFIVKGKFAGKNCTMVAENGNKIVVRVDGKDVTIPREYLGKKKAYKPEHNEKSSDVQTVSGGLPTLNKKKR